MDSWERIIDFDFPIARVSTPENKDTQIDEIMKLPTFSFEFDLS